MEPHACPGCAERDALIGELARQLAELKAKVRDLEAALGLQGKRIKIHPNCGVEVDSDK